MPPMSSTTTSTSGSSTTDVRVVRSGDRRRAERPRACAEVAHGDPGDLELDARCGARSPSASRVDDARRSAPPTLPQPSRPTRTASVRTAARSSSCVTGTRYKASTQGSSRAGRRRSLAGRRRARRPSRDEDDGGPRHPVVVRGHREAVGAGDRGREHVADDEVGGEAGVGDEDVAGLAVLADDPSGERPRRAAVHAGRKAS